MKSKIKFKYILFLLLVISVFINYYLKYNVEGIEEAEVDIELSDVKTIFPEALNILPKSYGVSVSYKNMEHLGYVLSTKSFANRVSGYGGPLVFLIGIDNDMILFDIKIIHHNETPGYINRLLNDRFLNNWIGLNIDEIISNEVNSVSGATMTSRAIITGMELALDKFNETLVFENRNIFHRCYYAMNNIGFIIVSIILLLALLSFYNRIKIIKKKRVLYNLIILIFLGLWLNYIPDLQFIFNFLFGQVSLLTTGIFTLIIMIAIGILITFISNKKFYCIYICPFGAAQEIASKLPVKKTVLSKSLYTKMKIMRKIFFLLVIISLIFEINFYIYNIHPFGIFSLSRFSILSIITGIFFVLISAFNSRFWCKYICPEGEFFDLFR